jgi:hypothetical protein
VLTLLLVRPTRYDEDGYVVRHWRGTLPSNTLSCLNGLTQAAVARGALGTAGVCVRTFDEAVDRIDPRRLARRYRRRGSQTVVALAGVQTNQFPRARDLALAFRREGCLVLIGGFHVSGSIAMSPGMPAECQELLDAGVTVVAGEVEDHWAGLLGDAVAGTLKPLYNFLDRPPDLSDQPLPATSTRLARKFAVRHYGTVDAGRGCPFQCSFCTIINVQGRLMRTRGAGRILDHVRAHYGSGGHGLRHYFFTDDNFARNPQWEAIFDGLITLRRDGMAVDFMMQVDTAAARIPRFVEKAAAAGCVQVFIGMESIRDDNLRAAGKRQNRVATYRESIARWHEAGIVCHVGFIVGFPHDTYDRIVEDVRVLADELLVDQASFFMLTPLPGSADHRALVDAGAVLDPDFNNFDSFRATTGHPRMSRAEWTAAYGKAWTEFYTFDRMRRALLRQNPHTYWGLFKCFLWYRASMFERTHPMVTGFVRLKDRRSRRPGWPVEGWLRFGLRRLRESAALARDYWALLLEMQDLWRETRISRRDYHPAVDLRSIARSPHELTALKRSWSVRHESLVSAGARRRPGSTVAHRTSALMAAQPGRPVVAPIADDQGPVHGPTRAYWSGIARTLRTGRVWTINPFAVGWHAARDARNTAALLLAMAAERF